MQSVSIRSLRSHSTRTVGPYIRADWDNVDLGRVLAFAVLIGGDSVMPGPAHRARLVISNAAADRLGAAAEWLRERGSATPVLVVGASRAAADELVRQVALRAGGSFGWVRTTLAHMAAELALPQLARDGRIPLTRTAAEALVARVVHDSRRDGALGVYERAAGGPGLVRALAATIDELRHCGTRGAAVRDVAPDLAVLLDRYEREMEVHRFADRAEMLLLAAAAAARPDCAHPWLDIPVLMVDVRAVSPAEHELVRALLARSPSALGTAPAGDAATERFLTPAFAEVEVLQAADGNALGRLHRHLFAEHGPDEKASDDSVAVLSAPGEAREAVEIARQLVALARGGVSFDRVAVALRAPADYSAHLEEAFARADIPAYFARGVVRPHPAGRAFVALLDCAVEGLSARRFAEYLSLGQVPDVDSAGGAAAIPPPALAEEFLPPSMQITPAPEVDDDSRIDETEGRAIIAGSLRAPRRWERLLSDAAVIGGLDRWRSRLQAAEGHLSVALADRDGAGDDAVREQILADLAAITGLRSFAMPILEQLDRWPERGTWREWLDRFVELAAAALRRPATVLELLSELAPMGPIGPIGLDEARLVLADRMLTVSLSPPRTRYGRVFVAPIEALRGMCFDVVFVPGLAERLFPRKIAEDPILLDDARRVVGAGLETNDERLSDERLLLRLAAGCARQRLVLSYPRLELAQGRPRVPSFYALEALRASEGTLPAFADLASRAERAAAARVGWPAPADPSDAIDEAEHDLALLERLRSRDAAEKVGAARFLLDANPHLGRALRFRARRWLPSWTPADGLVRPMAAAVEVMRAHGLEARSYSATALEKYAACPYQFFLYAVHRLAPREVADVVDDLDPLRRGSLVHDTQFALFGVLRDSGLLPVTAANLAAARDLLDRCLDAKASELRDQLLPRIERVWHDAIESIRADLREWLRRASEDSSGYVPWRFELAFGLSERQGRDEGSVAAPVALDCGIRLRGSIDLVERRRDGHLRATDHKTGKARMPARGVVAGGTGLQPVLYALALEKLYPDGAVDGGRLYYCTSVGGFEEREIALDGAARHAASELGSIVGEALSTPFLPASPARGACDWCDYRVVCGPYEEIRTARKPRAAVERLRYLRSMP